MTPPAPHATQTEHVMSRPCPTKIARALTPVLALAALLLAPAAAMADAVKVSGFWINDVNVQSIRDGQVVFTNAAGAEVQQPLEKLEGMRLTLYPALEQAEAALEAGDDAQAVAHLRTVVDNARQDWARQYAQWRLVGALGRAGQPVEAVQTYAALVSAGAEAHFLAEPPVEAVQQASDAQKQAIAAAANAALRQAAEPIEAHLQAIIDAAQVSAPAQAASETTPPMPAQPQDGMPAAQPQAATAPAAEQASAITLPQGLDDDEVTQLLRAGRFEEALAAAEQRLQTPGQLSLSLYQKGMAQLGLAEQTGDAARYKDAGLSFMRVLTYFPRSSQAAPAMVEAGYVHAKIGRPELARKLYDRAALSLSEEDDPNYHARLLELLGELPRQP